MSGMLHYPAPTHDPHWEGWEIAADDTHRYLWLWMGFNIRLIAVPLHDPESLGYDFGWCYARDPHFVMGSVAAWDSDTQDEPMGWHKRPGAPIRRAPRRAEDPVYNRDRCVHGYYVSDGCRTINCEDRKGAPSGPP